MLIQTNFVDYVHPDEKERLLDNYRRRMAGEEFEPRYKTKLLNAKGETIEVEINAGVITHKDKPANLVFVREIFSCE